MSKNNKYVESIQDLLDEGWTENKVGTLLNLHHVTVRRVIEKYGIEKYEAFDEGDYNKYQKVDNLDWLSAEDVLSQIIHDAFDSEVYIYKTGKNHEVSRYVKDTYGDLIAYIKSKDCMPLVDNLFLECSKCETNYNLLDFYTGVEKEAFMGMTCKKCRKSINHKFTLQNPLFVVNNNMRQSVLPYNLPFKEIKEKPFRYCYITGEQDYSFDHFVAVSTGHCGSYIENYSPLKRNINSSKRSTNPFVWISGRGTRARTAFEKEVSRLADANRLTPDEYRQFVCWCYDNKRDVDEIKRDRRHSIEIWREAVGKQFPLPRYVYEVGFLNESGMS